MSLDPNLIDEQDFDEDADSDDESGFWGTPAAISFLPDDESEYEAE